MFSRSGRRRAVGVGIFLAAGLGIAGLADAVDARIALAVGFLALLLAWPRWRRLPRLDLAVARGAGAALLALLALVGVNVAVYSVTHALHLPRLPIWAGLVLAALVFGSVAYWFLRRAPYGERASLGAALGLTFLFLVAAPILASGALTDDPEPVPRPAPVASKLDVLIVTDGRPRAGSPVPPPSPLLPELDVSYSVGFAAGGGVRWTLVGAEGREAALQALAEGRARPPLGAAPAPRPGADSVLLLDVDGVPPALEDPAGLPDLPGRRGEVARWRGVAAAAAGEVPTFALLQSADPRRLGSWRRSFGDREAAISVQELGSQTLADAAVQLAVSAPTSRTDFSLAMAYRPVLLFDQDEPDPWPLSVDSLFREGRVRLCHDQGVAATDCGEQPVAGPRALESGGTHLRLDLRSTEELRALARRELAAQRERALGVEQGGGGAAGGRPGAGTAIYVHPTSVRRDGKRLLYLDYWWYLTDNPVAVGNGALCGAGLVIAGVTCQSHQSDWEGMTVVVDRSGAEPAVEAVHYAQHADVVRYSWQQLRERWDASPKIGALLAGVSDASTRPLAFVAEGTHSTYPVPCGDCSQVAAAHLNDAPHRGGFGWVGNETGYCVSAGCLQMLPTRSGGREPALWNAFDGPWGEHHCFLTYYCDSGSPPGSPGHQGRYLHPTRYSGYVDREWRFHRASFEG